MLDQTTVLPQNACLVMPDSRYEAETLRGTLFPRLVPLEMAIELILANEAHEVLLVSFDKSGSLQTITSLAYHIGFANVPLLTL